MLFFVWLIHTEGMVEAAILADQNDHVLYRAFSRHRGRDVGTRGVRTVDSIGVIAGERIAEDGGCKD